MTQKKFLYSNIFFLIFIILSNNNINSLKLKLKTTEIESEKDSQDEIGGNLFEDILNPPKTEEKEEEEE